MSDKTTEKRRHRRYVKDVRLLAPLLDGPKPFEEILNLSSGYLRPLGLFKKTERKRLSLLKSERERLQGLIKRGWVICQGDKYSLTALGREEVDKRMSQLGETGTSIRKLLQPKTTSKVTTWVHWGLAAIKLPAALLSGSVGLLNDAIDTLLDGLSSLLVYFGIQLERERAVNVVLVILMLATGALTLYEAVRRFFVPFEPNVDWFTFLAALLSAFICLGLWAYQRYVGLRSGILALIIQSVDSRNHVIVAVSVTAGLIASVFRFPILDKVVGLGVALLIIKSAIELAVETIRSLGEDELDLSRFRFGIGAPFHRFLQRQLRLWMLDLVERQGVKTRQELLSQATQALDFNRIPAVQAMGVTQRQSHGDKLVENSLKEVLRRGWLHEESKLHVTQKGKRRLERWI